MIQTLNFSTFAGISSISDFRSELTKQRWRDGFVCPRCGCTKGYSLACRDAVECSACGKQTSSTAGTIFHGIRHLVEFTKILRDFVKGKRASAAQIASEFKLDLGTALSYLQKIRSALLPEANRSGTVKLPSTLFKPALLERSVEDEFQEVVAPNSDVDDIISLNILESQGQELNEELPSEITDSAMTFLSSLFRGVSRKFAQLYVANFTWVHSKRTIDFGDGPMCMQTNPSIRHEMTEYSPPLLDGLVASAAAGSRAPPGVNPLQNL